MEIKNGTKITYPCSLLAILGFVGALLAGAAAMLSGFGYHWGIWDYRAGFLILRWAVYAALTTGVISLLALVITRPGHDRRSFALSIMGLLMAAAVAGIPGYFWQKAHHVPAIHDITTDVNNPPGFVQIIPLRKTAANQAAYGGPKIAAQQRAAYPDIVPLQLSIPPQQAFVRALSAARSKGWRIIATDELEGRIEATDSTFWFGFTDDIVVRVTAAAQGSRIDIRSVSRVGKSDIGANARRIREFMRTLRQLG